MQNKGTLYGIAAYFLWGILPVYWKLLDHVSAFEILTHRIVWSFLFVVLLLAVRGQWRGFDRVRHNPKKLIISFVTAAILAMNWLTYIYAVTSGFIVEASLGYFINPLFNVFLGVIVLHERLRRVQWLAISIAALGVLYLTFRYGSFPWIALTLTLTFGTYGLFRKTMALESLEGLGVETAILSVPAVGLLFVIGHQGSTAVLNSNYTTVLLLIGAGVATALPLILFASAARQIKLSLLGFLQYIAPTLQFFLGVAVYHEPFTINRFIGFCFIWIALILYTAEGYLYNKGEFRNAQKFKIH